MTIEEIIAKLNKASSDASEDGSYYLESLLGEAADRIEALEQDFKAVLRREEGFHRAAMKHLRDLEQERVKSKNYAAFSHEWRERCEALEEQVRAADALAEALTAYNRGGAGPLTGWLDVEQALATYHATKEGGA